MKQLWAPWRIDYILGPKPDECVFCLPSEQEDEERLVLYRGKSCFVIMNKFPYNNGHIMVCPYRHVMAIEDLTPEESSEAMSLLQKCAAILRAHFNCEGINIGLNQGQAAGAGVREHLHFHLVPRWNGDSSFIAVMDEVRTMPQHLSETYRALAPRFKQMAESGNSQAEQGNSHALPDKE